MLADNSEVFTCCIPRSVAYHAYKAAKGFAYLWIGSANSGSHGDESDEILRGDLSKDGSKILVDREEMREWAFIKKEREEPNVRAQSSAGDTKAGHRYTEVALKSGSTR